MRCPVLVHDKNLIETSEVLRRRFVFKVPRSTLHEILEDLPCSIRKIISVRKLVKMYLKYAFCILEINFDAFVSCVKFSSTPLESA